jgi:hypothetical protein
MLSRRALLAASNSTTPGFGAKYANPATLPAGQGNAIRFSHSAATIAIAHNTTPCISVYPWSSSSGFGVKYSNPSTLPTGNGLSVAFSNGDSVIAIGHSTTPFLSVYPWSTATGFGVKFNNPATLPLAACDGVDFSPDDSAIAVVHVNLPYVSAYPWSSVSGFGTKYSNPATLPPTQGFWWGSEGVRFNPTGNALALSLNGGLVAYSWSTSGFGSKYADPGFAHNAVGKLSFAPDNSSVAIPHNNGSNCTVWRWSDASGFGSTYANPSPGPGGVNYTCSFNAIGNVLAFATTGGVSVYRWSSTVGFGPRYANPTTLPGAARGVSFSPSNDSIALACSATPFIAAYSFYP